jgi:dolichol-phosphate mannosyltransferase
MNNKLVYKDENGILAFFIGVILMFINTIEAAFNKNELMNFIMTIGINMMMFGVFLGFIGVMGQYIGRIFGESKGRPIYLIDNIKNNNRTNKKYNIFNLEQKAL